MTKQISPDVIKLRTLLVKFETNLRSWEVPAFRGAIIEKIGRENVLFNHHLSNKDYLYKYPLVQYKSISNQPAILCLGEAIDEIHKLFNKSNWDIKLMGDNVELIIDKLDLGNFTLQVFERVKEYNLQNWLGLNESNFKTYIRLSNDIDKTQMLEKIIVGNILSFAKGVNWRIEEKIKVRIQRIKKVKQLKYKDTHLMAFNLDFISNVALPEFIGLGKGASHGYGMLSFNENKY